MVWDGGAKSYNVVKDEDFIIGTAETNFAQVYLANLLVLTPWLNLIILLGLCAIHTLWLNVKLMKRKGYFLKLLMVIFFIIMIYSIFSVLQIIVVRLVKRYSVSPSAFVWFVYDLTAGAALFFVAAKSFDTLTRVKSSSLPNLSTSIQQ